jgi:hypothetical protein
LYWHPTNHTSLKETIWLKKRERLFGWNFWLGLEIFYKELKHRNHMNPKGSWNKGNPQTFFVLFCGCFLFLFFTFLQCWGANPGAYGLVHVRQVLCQWAVTSTLNPKPLT